MEAVTNIESVYKKFSQEYPFEYSFLDDDFERLYNNEKVAGRLSLTFTIMAIVISGLGLIGLAAYIAEKRKKEIGIRKTMGAAISSIVAMVTKDFVKLCLIAIVIGCPVAYYLMNNFLSGFAFHMDMGIGLFVYTAAIMLFFTLSIVIFQVTRAAMVNPVDVLRNE
ncbi:MAG: FtsX-like permease family protein [Cyclobacteriaceae bacterium]